MHIINYALKGAHCQPLVITNDILNVCKLNKHNLGIFIHKLYYHEVPESIKTEFKKSNHKCQTRIIRTSFKCDHHNMNRYNTLSVSIEFLGDPKET